MRMILSRLVVSVEGGRRRRWRGGGGVQGRSFIDKSRKEKAVDCRTEGNSSDIDSV